MSQIVTEVYDAFRAADVDDALAKAAASAVTDREDLLTKLDLERAVGALRTESGRVETDLRTEIRRVETDLGNEIRRVEKDLKSEIGRVETELGNEIRRVEKDLKAESGRVEKEWKAAFGRLEADMKLLKFGYGPAILGLLIKLVFFP